VRQGSASSLKRFVRFEKESLHGRDRLSIGVGLSVRQLSRGRLRRYAAWVRPHAVGLVVLFVISAIGIGIDMVWPLASAYLIDQVILNASVPQTRKVELIVKVGAGMVALLALGSGLGWIRTLQIQLINSRLSFELRSRLFRRILRLPLSELSEMTTGGILSRLSTDVDSTMGLLQQALLSPLLAGLRLVVTLAIIFSLNVPIATAVMVVIPPVLLLQAVYARRLRPIWRSLSQDRQDIDGRVSEGLSGVRVVRSFRREKLEELAYTIGHHTVIRKQLLATRVQRAIGTIWELIIPLAQLLILGFGGYLVIHGRSSIGVLVAFQACIFRVIDPISQIAGSISATQRGLAALDRVYEVLDKAKEQPDRPGARPAPARVEEIRFDHVGFEYRPGQAVLRDISLTVPGGTVLALVGVSGAGKTTLTDLLARFREASTGSILLNGTDVRDFRLKSYRGLIGVVSQEVFLFDGTVADNIAYGGRGATQEQIEDAARRAHAHEFIERMPDGYQTLIGERGVKLSGGQRQRLSIARALLADPPILILDEATSNLDTESERLIQESLRRLVRTRTTFVIAHRLSTIADADTIVVLERGQAAEVGSHTELMARGGLYRAMVERQYHRQSEVLGTGEASGNGEAQTGNAADGDAAGSFQDRRNSSTQDLEPVEGFDP
jgi:ATP-binding cassette subfamily B protein